MSTLKLNRQQAVKLPVGGEGFANTPLIGRWIAAILYGFMTETDMHMFSGFKSDSERTMGDWHRYYFQDYEQAKKWNAEAKNKYNPSASWVHQALTQNILNMEDSAKEKWGELIALDHCQVVTTGSKKYRHELHMISLPSAVSAYARSQGWDVPEFDFHELLDPNTEFTDDFQQYMVGSPDAKAQDHKDFQVVYDLAVDAFGDRAAEVVRRLVLKMPVDEFGDIPEPVLIEVKDVKCIHYEWSVLWERRAQLWKLLGSDDPLPYRPYGTAEEEGKPRNERFDAPANSRLDEAVGILAYPWSDYAYLQVLSVPDPRVDALTNDGKRLNIPAIVRIYDSAEQAKVEAEAELTAREAGGDVPPVKVTSKVEAETVAEPGIPEAWGAYKDPVVAHEKWTAKVRELKKKYPGSLQEFTEQVERAQALGTLDVEAACTAAEAVAWYGLV